MPAMLILAVAVAVLVLIAAAVLSSRGTSSTAISSRGGPYLEPSESPGLGSTSSWSSSWNPHEPRRRAHHGDDVTYRAGGQPSGAPTWDPYATEQSRVHRVREARHRPRTPTVPDYYAMLGLERGAPDSEIERAYRKAALRLHPDKFHDDPGNRALAEAKLKELNAAMAVLRSPTKRALYDAQLG